MLRVDKISCTYGAIAALREASIEVGTGEFVALIGANGAGKTTLLRTISGLLTPNAGAIEFNGQRIDQASISEILRFGIAHCPEERKLWPRLTVEEHLKLGAYCRGDRREVQADIENIYSIFPRLAERRKQLGGTLSGGEQQMAAVGRAIMSRPKLLMLDEPSLGLAPMVVEQMMEAITTIHRSGISILMVEQSAALALTHSDRAYVLENGSVVHQGKSADLLLDEAVQRAYLGALDADWQLPSPHS
jgi:branched-chain amino acid transport system ATP-binding protein